MLLRYQVLALRVHGLSIFPVQQQESHGLTYLVALLQCRRSPTIPVTLLQQVEHIQEDQMAGT